MKKSYIVLKHVRYVALFKVKKNRKFTIPFVILSIVLRLRYFKIAHLGKQSDLFYMHGTAYKIGMFVGYMI